MVVTEASRRNGDTLPVYFERNIADRALHEAEGWFVAHLKSALVNLRPGQLDAPSSLITSEGDDVLILVMPHRALGGLSLVAWLDGKALQILWGQVAFVDCSHDDLDRAQLAATFPRSRDQAWIARGVECIRHELNRRIEVVASYGNDTKMPILVETFACLHNKKRTQIGRVYRTGEALNAMTHGRVEQLETSLSDATSLPFRFAPRLLHVGAG